MIEELFRVDQGWYALERWIYQNPTHEAQNLSLVAPAKLYLIVSCGSEQSMTKTKDRNTQYQLHSIIVLPIRHYRKVKWSSLGLGRIHSGYY